MSTFKEFIKRCLPGGILAYVQRTRLYLAEQWDVMSGQRDPLMPPRRLTHEEEDRFRETGSEFLSYHVKLAGLAPSARVVEAGCGPGRMAIPLAQYLIDGSYDGFDVSADAIDWCQRSITRRYPRFCFQHADIHNRYYNPAGKVPADEFRFPYADASADYVFLTSVFTHLAPSSVERYLSEIVRVLRPGGRCLITWFLLNSESRSLMSDRFNFVHKMDGFWTTDPNLPEAATAYDEAFVLSLYDRYGLELLPPLRYGSWCSRPDFLTLQDLIVAVKPELPTA